MKQSQTPAIASLRTLLLSETLREREGVPPTQ